jgi:phosphate transport system permease protein
MRQALAMNDGPMPTGPKNEKPRRKPRRRANASLFAHGEPMVWLTGGGLVVAIVMIVGLLSYIFLQGITTLWPVPLVQVELDDGTVHMGEITREERYLPADTELERLSESSVASARAIMSEGDGQVRRRLFRTGNFDLTGEHFNWVSDYQLVEETLPQWALVVERLSWGRFYGTPKAFEIDGERVADDPETVWARFNEFHGQVRDRWEERRDLEIHAIGEVNRELEENRLALRMVELESGKQSEAWLAQQKVFQQAEEEIGRRYQEIREEIHRLDEENARYRMVLGATGGKEKTMPLDEIVRAYPANSLNVFQRLGVYFSRWHEFLLDEPREANSEGGIFPAIFGTIVMTLLMSLAVVPFGVMAALYIREYAKGGPLISAVRISINNLAGVPSIVFGVFGLGFFCYLTGAGIDELFFAAKLPNPTYGKGGVLWASLTLALLTLPVVIVATEEALAAVPNSMREGSYACGGSKWQTIRRIVMPRAMPGIMTGMILAMARGAGEVAPLMLVGAVKIAPELPMDRVFPYIHPERSFMHLGFHIYDLGFQSQNSEAAKPMVFTTTLLLIALIFILNILAVRLRTRLRKKFESAAF